MKNCTKKFVFLTHGGVPINHLIAMDVTSSIYYFYINSILVYKSTRATVMAEAPPTLHAVSPAWIPRRIRKLPAELRPCFSSSWEHWWPGNWSSRSLMWYQLACWLSEHLPHCLHMVSLLRGQNSAAFVDVIDAPLGLFYVFLWNVHHKGICESVLVAFFFNIWATMKVKPKNNFHCL